MFFRVRVKLSVFFGLFFGVGGPLPDLDLPPKPQSMNEVKSGSDDANMEE